MKKQPWFFKGVVVSVIVAILLSFVPNGFKLAHAESTTKQSPQTTEKVKTNSVSAKQVSVPAVQKLPKHEVTSLRTANSEVVDNGDGSFTKKIYQTPINLKQGNHWSAINSNLTKASPQTNSLIPENTDVKVAFNSDLTSGSDAYASFDNESQPLDYQILDEQGEAGTKSSQVVTPVSSKNQILHPGIFPQTDLRSIVFDTSVKEDLILNSYTGYNIYHYQVNTNLIGQKQSDGSVTFATSDGKIVYTIPKPFMSDSNIDPKSGDAQRSDNVDFSLEKDNGGYLITLTADKEWLKDPKRVYPVYIDPTTSINSSSSAFVMSAYPTTNYNKNWESADAYYSLKVGYYDSTTGTDYAYVHTSTSSLKYALIDSATFNIYTAHSYYPSTATGIWLDKVNASWSATGITWDTRPSVTNIASDSVYEGQWANFNVTSTVKDWVENGVANNGFQLNNNGNGQTYWKKFYSTDNSDHKPYLSVTYHYPTTNTPTVATTSNGDGSGYMNISWNSVTGATGYNVWIYDGKSYESFSVGNVTSWSTKGKGIWPTASEISAGQYTLHHDGKGNDLAADPSPVYKNSGGSYGSTTHYFIKVSAVFSGGESAMSTAATPTIPSLAKPSAPTSTSYNEHDGSNLGFIDLKWAPVSGATGYDVLIYNGAKYTTYDVGNVTSWTTKGKGIWPTASEISSGGSTLHTDGKGTDLPVDPSSVYENSYKNESGNYEGKTNYSIRVIAYDTHGNTVYSDSVRPMILPESGYYGTPDQLATTPAPEGSVNAFNGNYILNSDDLSLDGRGPNVSVSRTYNSQSTIDGIFGIGWTSNLEMNVDELYGNVLLTNEDGSVDRYDAFNANSILIPPVGDYDKLQKDATTGLYTLTRPNQVQYHFNTNGQLDSIVDRNGNTEKFTYTNNQLTSITDASGRVTNLNYGSNGKVSSVIDSAGQKWTYGYTGDLLTSVTDPQGNTTSYKYTNNQLTSIVEPVKDSSQTSTTTLTYTSNKLTSMKDDQGNNTTWQYANPKVTVTDPNGVQTDYSYNIYGNPYQTIEDTAGLKLTTTDTYANNLLTTVVDPNGQTTKTSYDANGNVISTTDANGTTTYVYDGTNDLTKETDPLGNVTQYQYDSNGNLISDTDPNGSITTFTYDSYGNKKTMTDPKGNVTTYTYDPAGNYLVSTIDPLNHSASQKTDSEGNVTSTTDGNGKTTNFNYDNRNLLNSVVDPLGNTTKYEYDAAGNQTSVTDALNNQFTSTYNTLNQLVSFKDPLGLITTYTYDSNGNIDTVTKPDGTTIKSTYDTANRLQSTSINGKKRYSFTYDPNGNLLTVTDSNDNQVESSTYDANNQLTSRTSSGYTLNYLYDDNGNLVSVGYPLGGVTHSTNLSYNENNQITKESLTVGNTNTNIVNYTYDNRENVSNIDLANGTSVVKDYNAANQLSTLTNNQTNGSPFNAFTYTYDANGNIIGIKTLNGNISYTYNALNELTNETLEDGTKYSYTYDAVGNRLSKIITTPNGSSTTVSYKYNAANEFVNVDGKDYSYDKNGNLISDEDRTYKWDANNNLTEVDDASGKSIATYEYDQNNRRIQKTVDGVTTKYIYNGDTNQIVLETDGSGNAILSFTYGSNGQPVTMSDSNGNIYYYQYNGHGDVIGLTDANGSIVAQYTYDAWGNILSQSGKLASTNPYRYAGYQYDEETSLYYLNARYYNSNNGDFLSQDPDGGDQSSPLTLNGYSYVSNNPIKLFDPSGESQAADELDGGYASEWTSEGSAAGEEGGFSGASKKATVRQNYENGKAAEAEVAKSLPKKGYKILGQQVSVRTSKGRRVVDILAEDREGNLLGIEVKSGKATRTTLQKAKDKIISISGGKMVGKNSPDYLRGSRVRFETIEIRK